ncbi:hypothetical protein GGR74_003224 [Xanthomonas arboricola]
MRVTPAAQVCRTTRHHRVADLGSPGCRARTCPAWRGTGQPPGSPDDALRDHRPAHDRGQAALLPFAA